MMTRIARPFRHIMSRGNTFEFVKIRWKTGQYITRHTHERECNFKLLKGSVYQTEWRTSNDDINPGVIIQRKLTVDSGLLLLKPGDQHEMTALTDAVTLHLYKDGDISSDDHASYYEAYDCFMRENPNYGS